jgi:putative ABC transport system substrate-binding protein
VEWITLPPQTRAHWELTPAVNEPLRAWIRPQGGADGRGGAAEARVFILFAKKSSAYDTAMRALLGRFRRADVRATFAVENFGGDPARGAEALRRMETGGYDLGLAMGSAAVTFLHKTRPDPSVPVVTICAKDPVLMGQMPDYASGSGRNIAYTSLNVPVALQLDYLREIVPGLSVIGVLYATENTSTVVTQVEPLRALAAEAGIGMIDVAVRDRSRAAEELQTLLPEAVREIRRADPEGTRSLFWITGATSVFREIETIDARSGGVPVLSAVPDVVRAGDASAVLSIGVSFESNAHLAAHYALRILRGRAAAAELPVGVVTPPDVAINFRKARAAGLRVPFRFFEAAGTVYDPAGLLAREEGRLVRAGSGE